MQTVNPSPRFTHNKYYKNMSKYNNKKILCVVIVLVATSLSNLVCAKTYRWTDNHGKVHYTQTIPPSGSQFGHEELNEKNGMTINSVESSDIKKQRLKKEQLENEKNQLKKQVLREELLIYMFSSKKELVTHFEERLEMISVNLRLLQYHKKKLKNTIKETSAHLRKIKASKLKIKLEAGLLDSQNSLIDHSRAIDRNQKERLKISLQMTRAIKTYEKKFGGSQLDVGSLIGSSALDKFRGKSMSSISSTNSENMCSCPCTAKK